MKVVEKWTPTVLILDRILKVPLNSDIVGPLEWRYKTNGHLED